MNKSEQKPKKIFFNFNKKFTFNEKRFSCDDCLGLLFSLRGRRRAAAALLYKVPGTQRVKRRSVRFVCSMSAKKTSVSSMVVAFFVGGAELPKNTGIEILNFTSLQKQRKTAKL